MDTLVSLTPESSRSSSNTPLITCLGKSQDYYEHGRSERRSSSPVYRPPSGLPPLPSGWLPQFDQHHQRWYYVDRATSQSQWEAPGQFRDLRGYRDDGYGGGDAAQRRGGSSKRGLVMGAAGGLAVGAVGGALLEHALDSDDSDSPRPTRTYSSGYGDDQYGGLRPDRPPLDEDYIPASASEDEEEEVVEVVEVRRVTERPEYSDSSDAEEAADYDEEYEEEDYEVEEY